MDFFSKSPKNVSRGQNAKNSYFLRILVFSSLFFGPMSIPIAKYATETLCCTKKGSKWIFLSKSLKKIPWYKRPKIAISGEKWYLVLCFWAQCQS